MEAKRSGAHREKHRQDAKGDQVTKARIGWWLEEQTGAAFDVDSLITSRALICANSGGGKSYCVRKTIEALCGKVQQFIIDTDGEFSSLREKFDFVVCSPRGGDAVAHPKTAALLCRRLLETKVSAVIDISELKVPERHLFVQKFIEALMLVGKDLWGPLAVILDEAQIYCPEKGHGESVAADAVIDLASRGRKRGFCLIAATQRLSKFRKDAAAELLNRLTGRTGLDLDVKRAAFDLGMTPKDAQAILPHLEPGDFYAFGPAISKNVRLLHIEPAETSHPKAGVARVKALPKPTAAITAVLPQLADLQQEAEQEAKTLQDLRNEVARLNREVREKDRAFDALMVDYGKAKVDAFSREDRKLIAELQGRLAAATKAGREYDKALEKIGGIVEDITGRVDLVAMGWPPPPKRAQDNAPVAASHDRMRPAPKYGDAPDKAEGMPIVNEAFEVSNPQQGILDALAWLAHKGISQASRPMVSAICKRRGGAFNNNVSALKTAGFIHYPNNLLALTPHGEQYANPPGDDGRELWQHWMDILTGPQKDILKVAVEWHQEDRPLSREELSNLVGRSGGAFNNNISAMCTMGALYYPEKGFVAVTKNVVP